ncbi:MAG TPA: biopolymer transporter ExbD [Phycisphaerae bacterium]|nr:biopolymer transporter ExbD [Phycisphaerales bacterium]HRX87373.1 biopolymer transporter ExbD [Phycisphaerae bacterium]
MRAPRYQHHDIAFNMAPLIDVVFLLIIFFTLVSTFASAENIRMTLPTPDKSKAQAIKIVDRVVINCQYAAPVTTGGTGRVLYSVGPNPPEDLDSIAQKLAAARQGNPKLKVIIRADKRLRYEQVRAVMAIVADANIQNLSLVAHVAAGEE